VYHNILPPISGISKPPPSPKKTRTFVAGVLDFYSSTAATSAAAGAYPPGLSHMPGIGEALKRPGDKEAILRYC
jgi:hypothetical protein